MLRTIFRLVMSLVLLTAGVAHFALADEFLAAMPPYIPFHEEIIFWTGVLELFFAIFLWPHSTRKKAAYALALYFVAILPAHLHTASNGVEMFGVASKELLWTRFFLQFPLIFWAYSLRK